MFLLSFYFQKFQQKQEPVDNRFQKMMGKILE